MVIEAELRDLQVEFDNQEGRLQDRAEEWKKWVEAIQDKLTKSFENYMSRLQYMGEVVLRVKDTFLDWGEDIFSFYLFHIYDF